MDVVEEVVRRRDTFKIEDTDRAYPEIRDLLERRMSFDEVMEQRYYHDVDSGTVRSEIETVEGFDKYSREVLEIYLVISKNSQELDVQIKGKIVTHYETEGWKGSLWYYAYRALYDKFLYGHVRHGFEDYVEEKANELMTRIRQNVEAA